MADENLNVIKSLSNLISKTFKKEIEEDIALEKKYSLMKTKEEVEKIRVLQERYKYQNLSQDKNPLNGIRNTLKWMRANYFNFKKKESIDQMNYARYMRRRFFYLCLQEFFISSIFATGIFIWMRMLKHKGSKDMRYFILMATAIAFIRMEVRSQNILIATKLPLNEVDLQRRKELLENFVFSSNRSFVITQQLKTISQFYFPDKIEFNFITPNTGQNIIYILINGRLYINTNNYEETFGYKSFKALYSRLSQLNLSNLRERDVIFGLLAFYDHLIEKFKKENNITKELNIETQILQKILNDKQLGEEEIKILKESNQIKGIEWNEIQEQKKKKGKEIEKKRKFDRFYF